MMGMGVMEGSYPEWVLQRYLAGRDGSWEALAIARTAQLATPVSAPEVPSALEAVAGGGSMVAVGVPGQASSPMSLLVEEVALG